MGDSLRTRAGFQVGAMYVQVMQIRAATKDSGGVADSAPLMQRWPSNHSNEGFEAKY